MSIVGLEFERLRRFNLAEIYDARLRSVHEGRRLRGDDGGTERMCVEEEGG